MLLMRAKAVRFVKLPWGVVNFFFFFAAAQRRIQYNGYP